MTNDEVDEILYPNIRKTDYEEGFLIFKKFFNQPIECGTTLNIDGYEPRALNGYRLTVNDKDGIAVAVTDEHLKIQYDLFLSGDEGVAL